MRTTYLFKIFTKELQTKFYKQTDSSMLTIGQVHKEIIDYLGKNAIEWEPNKLNYNGKSGFYITYEEVNDGTKHDVTLRQEDTTRV